MSKKIILFDIDLTLFNNHKFVELKDEQIIKIIGIKDIPRYKKILPNYLSGLDNQRDFEPSEFINIVCDEFSFKNKSLLMNLTYDDITLYRQSIFPEVESTFEKLAKSYELGIYSEGKLDFQNYKLKALGISYFLNQKYIIIAEAKDTEEALEKVPKESIIIDDKETICQFLTDNGFRAIWINRKDDRKSDNFETIYSLLELPAIL